MSEAALLSPLYALLSVSDKRDIVPLAHALCSAGYTLLSTGGTARVLRDAQFEVTDVSHLTQSPELFDGRVKTLHPCIHGGLLANLDIPSHIDTLHAHNIPRIGVLIVNLYPFEHTIAQPGVTLPEAIEQIDIGGPAMLRAAAKNFAHVLPICSPEDYPWLIDTLNSSEEITHGVRRQLAAKVFTHTAAYDARIASHLLNEADEAMPEHLDVTLHKTMDLRYGENPHQRASLYQARHETTLGGLVSHHGKALSYNNIVDLDAALALVQEFHKPCVAIIKHTNPAGCATDVSVGQAYIRALACDPTSAFGGIVAINRPVDAALAEAMHTHFFEVIAAPDFSDEARAILTKKKNLRILSVPVSFFDGTHESAPLQWRVTALGMLVQSTDPRITLDLSTCDVPTRRKPSALELAQLDFAWRASKHVKSNAIVLASDFATVGVGAGQMSRVDAVQLAIKRARSPLAGAVLASDAFFPFPDGPLTAIEAGITALVQPGGSVRDQQVIDACDTHGVAMVCTGTRHFRH